MKEMGKPFEHEAVGEVRKLDSSYIFEEPTKLSMPPKEAVGSVRLLEDIPSPQPDTGLDLPGTILYRSESIIREMHDQLRPDSLLNEGVLERLRMLIQSTPGSTHFEKLYEAEELVLRPTVEWVLSAETGAEFEFKWSMASHRNANNIVLMLLAAMPTRDLEEVHRQIKEQRTHTSVERLVHPGMPIKVRGVVRTEKDLMAQEVYLRNHRCSARVLLDDQHKLTERMTLLRNRYVYVLGIVQSVKKLTIRAGAILVGEATVS